MSKACITAIHVGIELNILIELRTFSTIRPLLSEIKTANPATLIFPFLLFDLLFLNLFSMNHQSTEFYFLNQNILPTLLNHIVRNTKSKLAHLGPTISQHIWIIPHKSSNLSECSLTLMLP